MCAFVRSVSHVKVLVASLFGLSKKFTSCADPEDPATVADDDRTYLFKLDLTAAYRQVMVHLVFRYRPPCSRSERSEASVAARGGGYQVKRVRAISGDNIGCKTSSVARSFTMANL